MKCYRWVEEDLTSRNGDTQWEVGKWQKHEGRLEICESGLHACKSPVDSLLYDYGTRWFVAETRGKHINEKDKFVASEMRLVREIPKKVLVEFSILCAERALPLFEKEYPADDRPRKAIQAAREYLGRPSTSASVASHAAWAASASAASRAASHASHTASVASHAASVASHAAWAASAAVSASRAASHAASVASHASHTASHAAWAASHAATRAAVSEKERKWQERTLRRLVREAVKE